MFQIWDVEVPAGFGLPGWRGPLKVWDAWLGRVGGDTGQDWGARLRGSSRGGGAGFGRSQQGLGCRVLVGFGVPGWRGSQQGLECWAGGNPGGILGLLMRLGSQTTASNLLFCCSV